MAEMSRTSAKSGRQLALERRRMRALQGAAGEKAQGARPTRRRRKRSGPPSGQAEAPGAAASGSAAAAASKPVIGPDGKEYCCEECARQQLPEPCTPCTLSAQMRGEEIAPQAQAAVDDLCEVIEQNPGTLGPAGNSVRAFCRSRRQELARRGRRAGESLGDAAAGARKRRRAPAAAAVAEAADASPRKAETVEVGDVADDRQAAEVQAVQNVCEIIETAPGALGAMEASVRAFCRERRRQLARMGKKALRPGGTGGAALLLAVSDGRERAKIWRKQRCRKGRSPDAPAYRPAGKLPRHLRQAPSKVEVTETLSGQEVTGDGIVGRSPRVTGDEAGACRVITGTEYLGAEQFEAFCGGTPPANPPKVQASITSREKVVTGTKVGPAQKVTGDEPGTCVPVTGTEYLGLDDAGEFCSAAPAPAPEKVHEAPSEKGLRITGVDEARDGRVTGLEQGIDRPITGTPYTVPPRVSEAPAKVEVSHTGMGKPVTGSFPARAVQVTGNEPGGCAPVTGTEYAPAEEVAQFCGRAPQPNPPKVMVDTTRKGLAVTGNIPSRSEKVTGDEAGSCSRITGTPYGDASRQGLCATGPEQLVKPVSHTAQGVPVSGTEASPQPGVTGSDVGACAVVSGTPYVSAEAMSETCGMTPPPTPEKVQVTSTWQGNPVSGVQVGPAPRVTGNEPGACATITGNGYYGREEVAMACPADAVAHNQQQLQRADGPAGKPMTGIQPGPDEQVTGVVERGICQPVTGTPYVGADQYAEACGVPVAGDATGGASGGFSIVTPARAARRAIGISGSPYDASGKITGSASKGMGLITGTPEFRHPHLYEKVEGADEALQAQEQQEAAPRVTGEATEPRKLRITGDDWSRSEVVTGTEGTSAQARNLTRRGGKPAEPSANARTWMRVERVEVPDSRITGSSGNTHDGAVVTVSGGARG